MKFWLRKPGTTDFLGPFTREEMLAKLAAGTIAADCELLEATGQTLGTLQRSTAWSPLSFILSPEEIASARAASAVNARPTTPPKKSVLTRCAIGSAVATVAVPVLWAVLTSALGGNAGLTIGWLGVLPVIIFVPLGLIVTIGLAITSSFEASKRKDAAKSVPSSTGNPIDRSA